MTRDLFGLNVSIDESVVESFAALRSLIEPIMHKYKRILEEKEHSTVESNFVKVPGNNPYYLTFCIVGKNIFLGLYDKDKKTVSDSCNWGDIKALGESEMMRLACIIENYIKNNQKMPSLNALDLGWREEIIRRKGLIQETQHDSKDTDKSYMDFESVTKRAFAAKPPPKNVGVQKKVFER